MSSVIDQALALWRFEGADCELVAERENRVFRVDHAAETYALRLHRRGYRTNAELWSELDWMGALAEGGLAVPAPVRSEQGAFLHEVEGVQVDVLTWLAGAPVGKTGEPLVHPDRGGLFRSIGREMARMHDLSDTWTLPVGFTRCAWDRDGLLGQAPVWDRFWDNPTLTEEDRALFMRLRDAASSELQRLESGLDFGLIHADLVRENVMVDGDRLQFIDFDDCGFGFRLFDLATTLLKNMNEPDYPELRAALIDGYLSVRDIDLKPLDLFILLRSASYVGWIIQRMKEEESDMRNARFVRITRDLARSYLCD